jgi:heat shock protein HtpX
MAIDLGFTVRKLVVYGTLLLLYIVAMGFLLYLGVNGWMVALLSGGFLFIQYFFSDRIVLWSTGARVVSESEAPRLHNMVENLASGMGIPKPRIAIMENDMPNAFATGRNYRNSVVAVTTGILGRLSEPELQAVLAHELTHIKNRDMFVITFASFVVSVLSFIVYMAFATLLRGDDERGGFGASMAAWMVSFLFSNTIGLILINTVSRYREYGADRGAALATRSPDNLISALKKIAHSRYSAGDARGLESAKALCISPTAGAFLELFSTHPSLEKRIAKLEQVRSEIRGY